jgi:hypothetical protein
MFELRPPPKDILDLQSSSHERPIHRTSDFIEEIRRRSSVFVDGDDSDGDYPSSSRRAKQRNGGSFGDVDAGAEDAEDYGEAGDFGDDEGDDDEVQNVGVGLGLEGNGL